MDVSCGETTLPQAIPSAAVVVSNAVPANASRAMPKIAEAIRLQPTEASSAPVRSLANGRVSGGLSGAQVAEHRCYLRDVDAARGTSGRALGAGLFGVVTTVAAVLAHWSGSGMTASPMVIAGGFVLAAVVGWLLLPRRRGPAVVLSSVGLQVAMHVAFAVSMAMGGMNALSMLVCQGGHVGGVPVDVPAGYLAPQHGALSLVFGVQGMPMLLAHVIAGAVSGMWLYAVGRIARSLAGVLHTVVRSAFPIAVSAGSTAFGVPVRPVPWREERTATTYLCDWVTSGCGRRGPPVSAPC